MSNDPGQNAETRQPPWFRTTRPLRIAIIGWARLHLGAFEGSGYNLSASELAAGLALAGHEVFYLSSGRRYDLLLRRRIRPEGDWRGVKCFTLFNSVNLSPAAVNFRNMEREIAAPGHTRKVVRWLEQVRADIVHIHSQEGLPLDLIPAIRATGRPVVVTPHNYWYLCPQVDLLHKGTNLCIDFEGGRRCVGCVETAGPAVGRAARRLEDTVRDVFGAAPANFVKHIARSIKRQLGFKVEGLDPASIESPAPDPELARGFDAGGPVARTGRLNHGLPMLPTESPPRITPAPPDQNEQFLSQTRIPLPVVNGSLYARRRAAGVQSLNHASLVTPPSRFLLDVHISMGLGAQRGRVVRLGQPHFDQIHRRTRRSPYYDRRPWTPDSPVPCRFAFLGTVRASKGLEVLAAAIPLLDDSIRRRCHFMVRAHGGDWVVRKRLAPFPEVDFFGGYDTLQLISVGSEYDVGVLPHIWFENSPLVLLEHLHAGKLVIASRLGGPVEWITEPPRAQPFDDAEPLRYNGVLLPSGDAPALAAAITRVIRGEVRLPSPREVHAVSPLRSYPDHVREVDAIYRELLADGGPAAAEPITRAGEREPPLVEVRPLSPAAARL